MPLPDYEFIDQPDSWRKGLGRLQKARRMAVDIEANSLFAYREEVCLIQVSIPGHDYIIDPFAGLELEPLFALFASPDIEKVFHACEYDLILLKRQYGAEVRNLFDTMWAARILGYKNMGLAAFLESHFGVTLSKKYQKANWGARPLTPEHLEYAQKDTHYLLELRDLLDAELKEKGRLQEAREIFEEECAVRLPDRLFDPESFWSVKGARDLRPRTLAIFRALYLAREEIAQAENKPPFKIINNPVLIYLAKTRPAKPQEVAKIRGVPGWIREKYAERIAQAVVEGSKAEYPSRPERRPRQDAGVMERFEKLQEWRKQAAMERGVESDVVLKRDAMWNIARENPADLKALRGVAGLGEERVNRYGKAILEAIRAQGH